MAPPLAHSGATCPLWQVLSLRDELDRPVSYLPVGKVDMAALRKQGVTPPMLVRRYIRTLETIQRAVCAAPHPERGQVRRRHVTA